MSKIVIYQISLASIVRLSLTIFIIYLASMMILSDPHTLPNYNNLRVDISVLNDKNQSHDHTLNPVKDQTTLFKLGIVYANDMSEIATSHSESMIDNVIENGTYLNLINYTSIGLPLNIILNHTLLNLELQPYINDNFDLFIGVGFVSAPSFTQLAMDYSSIKFGLVDTSQATSVNLETLDNLQSVIFKEHEGVFLIGAIGALATDTLKLGFIGALEIELIQKFQSGLEQGARYVDPTIEVQSFYVCPESASIPPCAPWASPNIGYAYTDSMIDDGVDILFHAASGSGEGMWTRIAEAQDEGQEVLGMGTDSVHELVYPELSLTSWIKQYDEAIEVLSGDLITGEWSGGTKEIGIADNGTEVSTLNLDKFRHRFDCASDFTVYDYIDYLKEAVRSGRVTVEPGFQSPNQYNIESHSCIEVRNDLLGIEPNDQEPAISPEIGMMILLGILILSSLSLLLRRWIIRPYAKITYTQKIEMTVSLLFNSHPELIHFFINPGIIKDQEIVDQFNSEVPLILLEQKFLLHPVRLAITKLLFDYGDFSTIELKNRLGVSWDELNNNLKVLKKKNVVKVEKGIQNDRIVHIVSFNPIVISDYEHFISTLLHFLTSTPNFELYVQNSEELAFSDTRGSDEYLYPDG